MPDVKIVPITTDTQFIMLACDGCWDVKSSQECVTFTAKNIFQNQYGGKRTMTELTNGMSDLLDSCCAKDLMSSQGLGTDNITALVVELIH